MLRIVTTADTEILATAAAVRRLPEGFPDVRCANPAGSLDAEALVEKLLDGARVVLCRVLGGRRGWPEGFELLRSRCAERGIALIALGGEAEPDAEMTALSLAPAGAVAQAGEYLRHGDIENVEQLLRFLADTFLLEGYGFEPPHEVADMGVYVPGQGDVPLERALASLDRSLPTIGICFYRSHRLTGNTAFVDELCAAVQRAGANAIAVWSYTLRRTPTAASGDGEGARRGGRVPALELLDGNVDALLVTMLATGGTGAADAVAPEAQEAGEQWQEWDASALAALDVPVIQAVCATRSRAAWEASDSGLEPLDAATQVAIPEFDGRLLGGVVSFKEREHDGSPVGAPLARYVPDPERCARVARLAVRHARLRHVPAAERRVAILLTSFPTKHARVGMAVGLDTPASALELLAAMSEAGMRIESPVEGAVPPAVSPDDGASRPGDARTARAGFSHGDELMHALIAGGGHDPEFLTDEQLSASPLRLPVSSYLEWYAQLPGSLREAIEARWGPPPGDRYLDGEDFVIAGLQLGNVLVAIQPPRGYGEDPVSIYHDPELPPTHHYLACYWWLDRMWKANAIVHLGKHGTLEWLPGKMLGLSAACAPDAVLGDVPLVYPFVVNDPGEGVQAKRRAHAVIVDHLVPPMMRADTYDELAELEALLDEYARLEVLDPSKLPALAARIWAAIEAANLQADLGVQERPDDLGALVEHIDGYLCEVKDIQIKDGLHVLGRAPEGEQLRGLVAAMLKLERDQEALLDRLVANDWQGQRGTVDPARVDSAGVYSAGADPVGVDSVGADTAGVDSVALDPAVAQAPEIVARIRQTPEEIRNVLRALEGRHVPSGPSGSPTRGRMDVLPTGRNFYSVDPRALPSELSWEVGQRLAQALLDRHMRDHGELPKMVGLVAWGTSAMRTQGDDVAEIFALLGVKPVWNQQTKRVTGIEVIPLPELGRARVDVTVRISGFFRDAFPHLVELIDDAVSAVAALEEPDELNPIAVHARADAERLAVELASAAGPQCGARTDELAGGQAAGNREPEAGVESAAWRQATTRVFGSKPGTYGAGLLQLVDARDWRDDGDIAEVYEAWGGYAYGRRLSGEPARGAMRDCFARIEVAVKNVDSREHDILDSDDYFQYHGGMVATVRALTGSEPAAYVGDSSDPSRVMTRTLSEETRRVFRARVANPRWIASMIRHGYKGAAELSATVDYLFGYSVTAGAVEDWMYEQVAERYLLDEDVARFMGRSNPWAARAIAERLLEAADRGLWQSPAEETIEGVRERFLALEGELEEAEEVRS